MRLFDTWQLWCVLRMVIAGICGGIIGLERTNRAKEAGVRTHFVVAYASALMMIVSKYGFADLTVSEAMCGVGADGARLAAQVVSGIGFLGAGTIIVTPRNHIKGLTTAAGLWTAACIGLALGIGLYEAALVAAAAVYAVLTILHHWDLRMRKKSRVVDVYVELDKGVPFIAFLRSARKQGLELQDLQREEQPDQEADTVDFMVTVKGRDARKTQEEMVEIIRNIEGVRFFEVV